MYTLEEVREKLQQRRLPEIAKATGLSYGTVRKLAAGDDKSVSYMVVKKLSDHLKVLESN
jgi:transcriptional regulator with XRE-family HTH domain